MTSAQRSALIALVVLSAALRIWWNDVAEYSPADESAYAGVTRHLGDRGFVAGYPEVVSTFVSTERLWRFPTPFRYGYYALARAAAAMYGAPEPHALAWLSTLAGILVVPLVFVLGRRWFDVPAALLATAFTAFSSIELALGRRALQDEVFCCVVVVAVLALLSALDSPTALRLAAAIGAMTFAFAVKETFVLLYPALIAISVILSRGDGEGSQSATDRSSRSFASLRMTGLFALPPILWYVGFSLLARDFGAFFRVGAIVLKASAAPYALAYQSGPPHRPLFDLLLTAPLVSILAAAAVVLVALGRGYGRRERALVVFLILAIAVFGIAPSKNLRFLVVVDPFIRLAAAWLVTTLGRGTVPAVAFAAVNASIELELFGAIFIKGGVYDPVTQPMLEALAAVPHESAHPVPLVFPWVCAAIGAAAWVVSRRTRSVV